MGVGAKRADRHLDGAAARVWALRADQIEVAAVCGRADWSGDWHCEHNANRLAYEDYSSRMIISRISPSMGESPG